MAFNYDTPRETPSAYKKKPKPVYQTDTTMMDFLDNGTAIPITKYPLSSSLSVSFKEVIFAEDERTEALIDTKKGRKEQVHGEYSKAYYCLSQES